MICTIEPYVRRLLIAIAHFSRKRLLTAENNLIRFLCRWQELSEVEASKIVEHFQDHIVKAHNLTFFCSETQI